MLDKIAQGHPVDGMEALSPALVDGMVSRIEAELDEKANVISTGGLSGLITPLSSTIDHHEPWLTLVGLRLIYERNVSA